MTTGYTPDYAPKSVGQKLCEKAILLKRLPDNLAIRMARGPGGPSAIIGIATRIGFLPCARLLSHREIDALEPMASEGVARMNTKLQGWPPEPLSAADRIVAETNALPPDPDFPIDLSEFF